MVFDQYQRYKTSQLIINEIKRDLGFEKLRILEVGANSLENLTFFLPDDDIYHSDIAPLDNKSIEKKFFVADATCMPEISDNAFDVVIAMDVYEHIPPDRRELFMSEVNRVASLGALICFPFYSPLNVSAERRANKFYILIYGEDHKWLSEHLENGLPNIDDLIAYFEKFRYNYELFYHGDITIWEKLIKALFYSYLADNITAYREEIDMFYEDFVYRNDISPHTYRVFSFSSSNNELVNKIKKFLSTAFTSKNQEAYKETLEDNLNSMYAISQLPQAWINWCNKEISIYDENLKVALIQRNNVESKLEEYDLNLKEALKQKENLLLQIDSVKRDSEALLHKNIQLRENIKVYDENLLISNKKVKVLEEKVNEYDRNLKIALSRIHALEESVQEFDRNLKIVLVQKAALEKGTEQTD